VSLESRKRVVIIGGGWAGLACAIALLDHDHRSTLPSIELFEAAPQLGGRARSLQWQPTPDSANLTIDNGQHMLVGAYRETLALMQRLGAEPEHQLARFPLTLRSSFGLHFRASALPAPWHLVVGGLSAKGIGVKDAFSALRFALALLKANYLLPDTLTVSQLMVQLRLSQTVQERMLRPLCLATLNTAPALASAKVFAAVLRDTIGASTRASHFLVAKHGLSALLPNNAQKALSQAGVKIHLRTRISDLNDNLLDGADAIVIACPLAEAASLALTAGTQLVGEELPTEAIATIYMYWQADAHRTFAQSFARLTPFEPLMLDDLAADSPGQWFFFHGQTSDGGCLAAVVVSAYTMPDQSRDQLSELCTAQLEQQLALPMPTATKVIVEKRATFRAAAGSSRPANDALQQHDRRLVLAGDYTIAEYPATLESAVRSGLAAAQLVQDNLAH
jgi:hydroxysqualene dehydroxylase